MWLVERNVFPTVEESRLNAALSDLSCDAIELSNARDFEPPQEPFVCRGSCALILQASSSRHWLPNWGTPDDFRFSIYAPALHSELLNVDYELISFGELCWRHTEFFKRWGGRFFVRPDDGFKSFEGGVVHADRFEEWVAIKRRLLGLRDSLAVIVAGTRPIDAEWRVFLHGSSVVCASRYSPYVDNDVPERVLSFAQTIATRWNPKQRFCTLDIAASGSELGVLEAGSAFCTALYAAEPRQFIVAVQQALEVASR